MLLPSFERLSYFHTEALYLMLAKQGFWEKVVVFIWPPDVAEKNSQAFMYKTPLLSLNTK